MNLTTINYKRVEYVGWENITQSCIEGLMHYLQSKNTSHNYNVKLITYINQHGLIIYNEQKPTVVIKPGFTSDSGTGQQGLAYAISILEEYNIEIEEVIINYKLFNKINRNTLNNKDFETLAKSPNVRPYRIQEYGYNKNKYNIESKLPLPIPLRLIDHRIRDLAINFWTDPGEKITTGFKRLETLIKQRINTEESSSSIFARAFMGKSSTLQWQELNPEEQKGIGNLFIGAYQGFRNPRAHREIFVSEEDALSEFFTLNHLFRLENKAKIREPHI
jgi:hypothetical protein